MGNSAGDTVSRDILEGNAKVILGGALILGFGHVTGLTAKVQDFFAEAMANPHSTLGVVIYSTEKEAAERKSAKIVPVDDLSLPKVTE